MTHNLSEGKNHTTADITHAAASAAPAASFSRENRKLSQLALSDGMRRPVSGRDAVYAPKLSTCSRHR